MAAAPTQETTASPLDSHASPVSASGTTRTILQLAAAGADFGYIEAQRLAIVPYLFGNNVAAYDLTNALK